MSKIDMIEVNKQKKTKSRGVRFKPIILEMLQDIAAKEESNQNAIIEQLIIEKYFQNDKK